MPDEVIAILLRIESKLDTLLAALADEGEDTKPGLTLDGEPCGAERPGGLDLG